MKIAEIKKSKILQILEILEHLGLSVFSSFFTSEMHFKDSEKVFSLKIAF